MKTARERSAKQKAAEAKATKPDESEPAQTTEAVAPTTGEKRAAEESESSEAKKPRLDAEASHIAEGTEAVSTETPARPTARMRDQSKLEHLQSLLASSPSTRPSLSWTEPTPYPPTTIYTKPASEMRGHTSYLTFATLYPASIRAEAAVPKTRVNTLKEETGTPTEGSEYGSEGLEEVMRTMTEEEMMSLSAA
jgi:tRNA (adenine57-N1/adenine58-N1)-methyltransferase